MARSHRQYDVYVAHKAHRLGAYIRVQMQGCRPMMPVPLINTLTQALCDCSFSVSLPDCSSHYFPFENSLIQGRTSSNFVHLSDFVRQSVSISHVSEYSDI